MQIKVKSTGSKFNENGSKLAISFIPEKCLFVFKSEPFFSRVNQLSSIDENKAFYVVRFSIILLFGNPSQYFSQHTAFLFGVNEDVDN